MPVRHRRGEDRFPDISSTVRPMRVGLVCPYSLSLPGGVQGQVLGLARELRRQGHEAACPRTVRRPAAGGFRHPARQQPADRGERIDRPARARSRRPSLRTIRVLNDERFDVVHVHEPLAPGPPMTTVMMRPAPLVGTFHAAGRSSSYVVFRPIVRWLAARIDRKVVVSKDALELAQSHLGGEYSVLFNGVEVDEIASTAPSPADQPDDLLPRPSRGTQGTRRPAPGLPVAARRRPVVDRRRRSRRPPAPGRVPRRRPHLVARPDQRRREVRPPAGRFGALRAVAARRVVRRRADRGDGGGHPRRGQRHRRLPQRRHRRARRPARPPRRCRRPRRRPRQGARRRVPRRLVGRGRAPPSGGLLHAHAGRRIRPHLPRAGRDRAPEPLRIPAADCDPYTLAP